jgi:hypothetical protein
MPAHPQSSCRPRHSLIRNPLANVISQWWHDRRRDAAALTIGLFVALAAPAAPAHAQVHPDDFSIAGSIAEGVGTAVRDFTDLVGASFRATAEIEEARRQYWAAYPDGPGLPEASARFAHALWQKDQLYMMGFLVEGPPQFDHYQATPSIFDILGGRARSLGSGQRNLGELLLNLAGGVDGGIDPDAQRWFFEWVREVRRAMGARNDRDLVLFNPLRYPAALVEAQHTYERYVRHRDAGELWRSPHSPLLARDPRRFLAAVFARLGTPHQDATQQAEMLSAFVGPDAFAEAVRALRRPGEDPRQVSRSDWEHRRDAFHGVLKDNVGDDARGLLTRIYLPDHPRELSNAIDHIQSLFAEFGETRVLEVAERLRAAPRREIFDTDHLTDFSGRESKPVTWWLLHLLENPDATLPTTTEAYYVDAANTEHIRRIMEAGHERFAGGLHFVGTVTRASAASDGWGVYLHLAGAEDMRLRMHPRLQLPYGNNAERVVGKTVLIQPSTLGANAGRLEVLVQTVEQLRVADAPVQPVTTLPERESGRVRPGPPNREDVELASLGRLRSLFERESPNLTCSVPHGEHRLKFSLGSFNVSGDRRFPRQARLHMQTRFHLETDQELPTGARLALVRRSSGNITQFLRIRELDWSSAAVEQAEGDCLVLRIPVDRLGRAVAFSSSPWDGTEVTEQRAEFELRFRAGSGAGERIVEAMRSYVASDVHRRAMLPTGH